MSLTGTMDMINSLIRTVGLVMGGLWVAWTFHKLQRTRAAEVGIRKQLAEIEKALAESQKALTDTQKAAAETDKALAESQKALTDTQKAAAELVGLNRRHLSQQPNLEIEFAEIVEHHVQDVTQAYLTVLVELRNIGSLNLRLEFSEATLTVGRFDLLDKRLKLMSEVQRLWSGHIPKEGKQIDDITWRIFRVGQRRQIVFLVPVQDSGFYLVEFNAMYYKHPFDGEEDFDQVKRFPITAWQQRVVAVGLDGSKTHQMMTVN